MWIRKSEAEIQQFLAQREADRKRLARPLLFAAAIAAVVTALYALGLRGCSRRVVIVAQQPHGFNWQTASLGLFMFAFISAVAIYRQRRHGYIFGGEHDIRRCRDCKELAHVTPRRSCPDCGGKQEPSEYFSWIENENFEPAAAVETGK